MCCSQERSNTGRIWLLKSIRNISWRLAGFQGVRVVVTLQRLILKRYLQDLERTDGRRQSEQGRCRNINQKHGRTLWWDKWASTGGQWCKHMNQNIDQSTKRQKKQAIGYWITAVYCFIHTIAPKTFHNWNEKAIAKTTVLIMRHKPSLIYTSLC